MGQRTFLLGVGAQKGGTSWLWRYLDEAPNVRGGFTKEYHIWDAVTLPECRIFRIGLRNVTSRNSWRARPWHRWLMQSYPEAYFRYFSRLVSDEGSLTFDITPSYCGLSTDTLQRIRDGFARRGVATKVVFLMRDPFERNWSVVRMLKRGGGIDEGDQQMLHQSFATPEMEMRTRYDKTVENLEAVFSEDDLYFGIFETMFEEKSLRRLSEFLDVPYRPELVRRRFNATRKDEEIDGELRQAIMEHYRGVYDFCFERFPESREVWNDPSQ